MKKYKTGLIMGRFQPFHKGHLFLLLQSLCVSGTIIIGVGSINKKDLDNPYSFKIRKKMIMEAVKTEKLENRVKKIVAVKDIPDDDEWFRNVLKKTGSIDVVIGNNDWVNGIFKNAGYNVLKIPFLKRDFYEGKKIRSRMRNNKEWKDRVPLYISRLIEK